MPTHISVDLSTAESEREIDQYIAHIERINEENSSLSIRNEMDGALDSPRVARMIQAAIRNQHITSLEFDSISLPLDAFCEAIESNQLLTLHLLNCEIREELEDEENSTRIAEAFTSNKYVQKLVLNDCSETLANCIYTGLRMHTALEDIAVQPEPFDSFIKTLTTLSEVIQTVPSLRSVYFCSIDWDRDNFIPIATALQNSLVSKISFMSCTFNKSACAILKSIFNSPDVPRSLFFDVDSAAMESGHVRTLIKMTKSAPGLQHLSLWNSALLTKDEMNGMCQALVGETNSRVQEWDLAPPAPGRLWSHSELTPEVSQVLIKHLPNIKFLKRITFSLEGEGSEQKREVLSAIYQNGSIPLLGIRMNAFQESDFEFIRQCEQRNKNLLNLLLVDPEETQDPLALRPRLFHHAFGTRFGVTMVLCSLLKMESIGKPDNSYRQKLARKDKEE
jgi:hypothetical protein